MSVRFSFAGALALVVLASGGPAAAQDAAANGASEAAAPAGDPVAGAQVYAESCEMCHGANGKGGQAGGVPFTAALTAEDIVAVSTTGRNAMPAFETIYSEEDLQNVAAYIVEELVGAE